MTSDSVVIGIDIGGTNLKLGLVDAEGHILARRRLAYGAIGSFESLVDALAGAAGDLEREAGRRAAAVGIAAPGHARAGDGVMVDGTANVPLLKDRSLAKALAARTGRPCAACNDGVAAALGELRFGAGRGLDRFAVVTLGTGVGGGVAIGGRIVAGDDGEPPEIGAMVLDESRGGQGTLEAFACARGFAAAYERLTGRAGLAPQVVFERAAAGDAAAGFALDATFRRIAQACGTLINVLNLQAVLLGGGIAGAGAPLREGVRRHLPDFTWPFLLARARLELAATGADAGVLGAAARAQSSLA